MLTDIHAAVLTHLRDYPEARFVTDTQLVLDPATGAVMNLDHLLSMLRQNPAAYRDEIIEHFVTGLTAAMSQADDYDEPLDRRTARSATTTLIFPEGSLMNWHTPAPLARGLSTHYSLVDGDALATMPADRFLAHASAGDLEESSRRRVRTYARNRVSVTHEMGGVLLNGGRQTSSIALFIEDCAKILGLERCAEGYFVAVPDSEHCAIIPAQLNDMLLPLFELTLGTYTGAEQPFVPYIFHVRAGEWSSVIDDRGLCPSDYLIGLHGPAEEWALNEGFWEGSYIN